MTQINLLTFSMRSEPPKAGSDWFRIVQAKKGEATKVYIYDEIGFWGTTAKDFAATLGEIDTDEIELHLNSPGGSVFDGLAIMAALKDHKARVVGKVDGMAASAASFILQACDERLITRNAQVMIHDAKAYAGGNAAQMRKAADLLDRVSDNIADIYAVRSGQGTVESWRAIMVAGDEWYSGNEAVEAGLVDAVVDNPEEDEDAPEESSNTWSTEEVEAFLQTPPEKLAASAKHVTITNRVEEAHMTGPNPQKQTTPPAAPQPPAPQAQQQAPAPEAPSPVAGVTLLVNGLEVTDLSAVQAHITGLEAFKKETIEGGRKAFVAKLAADNKIMANEETLTATETFALSLSSDQFEAWKKSMGSAPANNLFGQHGTTGVPAGPQNGGSTNETESRIATLKEIVQSHRDAGVPEDVLQTKASYKELQQLTSTQTGA
jgi:ATP-dependent Clp endopeptidase proteolytic subunit ClpP